MSKKLPGGVRVHGPLAGFAAGFADELSSVGYTQLSTANQLRVMAHFSRWMLSEGLEPGGLSDDATRQFLLARRAGGYTHWLSPRGMVPLIGYLRSLGVVPPPPVTAPCGPWEGLLASYGSYLAAERGITPENVAAYVGLARRTLSAQGAGGPEALSPEAVTCFLLAECRGVAVGTAKLVVVRLRSLLRFLHREGLTATDLAGVVPAVAGWRDAGVPKYLGAEQLRALLGSCDRRRAVGRRDFAMLVVMSRLGLRRGEVVALDLGDFDWRAGEVVVKGKGGRDERLPLPADVGEAVASYLTRGRQRGTGQQALFLSARAPQRRLSPGAVTGVVHQACRRAGLPPAGAHRLRHTAATEMLRAGASLPEVGQVLRHRYLSTTSIYAKADQRSLRELARPWPDSGERPRAGLWALALAWPGAAA
jgi:integrase/recombinase XerD